MPLSETLSWALNSKFYDNMVPQKELSQTMGLISKTTLPGPRSMALSGYIASPVMHSLWENQRIQWTVKDYTEINGSGTFKHCDMLLV